MDIESKGQPDRNHSNKHNTDSLMSEKSVEVKIELDDTGLQVRGFATYLELIDRFYGRSYPRGYRSYAQRPDDQVEFAEVRPGSLELVISEILSQTDKVAPVLVLYLLLKYLPDFLKSVVSVYRDFEEAKYLQVRRANLEKQMEDEEQIKNLDQDQRQELVEMIDETYIAERDTIRKSMNFIESRFRAIKLNT